MIDVLEKRDQGRFKRMAGQVFRLLYSSRPSYQFFVDRENDHQPWFMMLCLPRYSEWDAYRMIDVLRQMLRDIAATARQYDDPRFALMVNALITILESAAQTEPMEGERRDGKLRGR